MIRALIPPALLAAFVAACASTHQAIPLSGDPADLQALAGEWAGEYHSYEDSGRAGTIYFRLAAGQDSASGDVLMHIAGSETVGTIPPTDPWAHAARSQLLSITFVRAAGGTIYGQLDAYRDPICGCEMRTSFTGRVKGNLIEGTYESEHIHGGDRSTGSWRVHRSFQDQDPGQTRDP